MAVERINDLRAAILANLRKQDGEAFKTSILSSDKDIQSLLDALDSGAPITVEEGTNSSGQVKFLVGISKVGGSHVVG